MFFSWLAGVMVSRRKTTGKEPFPAHYTKCTYYQHDSALLMLTLITYVVFVRFLHFKVTLFSPFILSSLEESHHAQPTLKDWYLGFSLFRVECLNNLFGILLCGKFVSSPPFVYFFIYCIICLFQYRLIDTYTLAYNSILFIYFVAQVFWLWPLRGPTVGSYVPLTLPS